MTDIRSGEGPDVILGASDFREIQNGIYLVNIAPQISDLKTLALRYFEDNHEDPTFGNARGVRNFFDKVVMNQATRILSINSPTDVEFRTIVSEDIHC